MLEYRIRLNTNEHENRNTKNPDRHNSRRLRSDGPISGKGRIYLLRTSGYAYYILGDRMINASPRPKPKPEKRKKKTVSFKKRKPKTDRQKLEIEADRIIRAIVLLRDDNMCCCPEPRKGHSAVMQAGHLITRTCKSVRWDLWNVNVQCSSCNMIHEHKPERYTKWFIRTLGATHYMNLVERSTVVRKIPDIEMRQLCAGLNSVLVGLQLLEKHKKEINVDEFRLTQDQIINIGRIVIPDDE